jgi:hypothetical protein
MLGVMYSALVLFPIYTGGNWVEWVVLLFFFALKILGQEILSENENNLRGNLK